jgi:predicted RNA-binding protein
MTRWISFSHNKSIIKDTPYKSVIAFIEHYKEPPMFCMNVAELDMARVRVKNAIEDYKKQS